MFGETGILFSFSQLTPPHPNPLPAHGERERIWNGTANPGFRLRSTLGYKYFAPSRAWAKQSTILISGFYVLVAAGGSVACGDRDIKGDSPWLVSRGITHMRFARLLISMIAWAALAAAAQAPPVSAEKLAADKEVTTSGGATFTAPGGWSMVTSGSLIVVEPPEADSHVVIFDSDAATADAAIDAAWAAYKRGEKRAVRQKLSPPAREGWEEVQVYLYETSPNERAVVQAVARRAKNTWTVVILNGKQPTFEKRGAAVGLIMGSLRPGTYQRESFAGRKAGALNAERLAQMKEFVEMAMKKLDVPGVGVAFIDNGKIVYEGGHGVKELGKPDAVDANTLFMAASNTKGMTTLLLAKLVDEGKVKWDDFVTKAYPKFKLGDARTTEQVRIEHLICACTGLPRQDLPWLFEFRKANGRALHGDAGQDAADQRVWRGVPVQQHHGVGCRVRGRVPVQSEARTGRSL